MLLVMLHGFAWTQKNCVHLLGCFSLHDWTASSRLASHRISVGHFLLLGQLPQDVPGGFFDPFRESHAWKKSNHPQKNGFPPCSCRRIISNFFSANEIVTSASQNEKPILWGVAGWKNQGEHEGTHQPCLCKESSTPSLYKQPQPPKNSAMRQEASWDCESHKWSQSIFHLFERHHLSWSHLCGCTKTVWC